MPLDAEMGYCTAPAKNPVSLEITAVCGSVTEAVKAVEQRQKDLEKFRTGGFFAPPPASYSMALVLLRAKKSNDAAAEFRKILNRKGRHWGLEYTLSYVGLARALVLTGDTAAARKAYEDFFALWKDADPDIPILIEAKQVYATLK